MQQPKGGHRGSPPQVRGKPRRPRQCRSHRRITPAGAGKTGIVAHADVLAEDHPRRCGENDGVPATFEDERGSPPQVRGKPLAARATAALSGITPAGAGKTAHADVLADFVRDHPRRCGEN